MTGHLYLAPELHQIFNGIYWRENKTSKLLFTFPQIFGRVLILQIAKVAKKCVTIYQLDL